MNFLKYLWNRDKVLISIFIGMLIIDLIPFIGNVMTNHFLIILFVVSFTLTPLLFVLYLIMLISRYDDYKKEGINDVMH